VYVLSSVVVWTVEERGTRGGKKLLFLQEENLTKKDLPSTTTITIIARPGQYFLANSAAFISEHIWWGK